MDAQTDAGSPDAHAAPVPSCGNDARLTYGHDAACSFASDGCITGPLTSSWSYTPTPI